MKADVTDVTIAAGIVVTILGVVILCVGAVREDAAFAERENAQGVELAIQKAEIADLKQRVHQLEDDMDRVAPHTVPTRDKK